MDILNQKKVRAGKPKIEGYFPLLAFDEQGHRVGYGKGFYDKLLSKCKPDCKRIGLSLLEPTSKIDDINPHDGILHACITPSKTWDFEGNVNR